jgi:CheY-like chemotaxis protein
LEQLAQLTGVPMGADASMAQVLIIDDEPASRYVLSKLLNGKRCRIKEASNGVEGLQMVKASPTQLVFLDLNMPDLSGFEVLKSLKADASTQSIPVAVVTSMTLSEANRRLLEEKACAIINKTDLSRERIDHLWQQVLGERQPS